MNVLDVLIALAVTDVFDRLDIRFEYTARFLCHLMEWYL